jgi:hypothetical protein
VAVDRNGIKGPPSQKMTFVLPIKPSEIKTPSLRVVPSTNWILYDPKDK